MNIGEAAARSGVSTKMIRYYESIGLISAAKRTEANYRAYSESDVHRLRFIRRARDLGFPIAKITELLGLWSNQRRSSEQVKSLALQHIQDLKTQIIALQDVVRTLESLARNCHGDDRPECPIIEDLAAGKQIGSAILNKNKGARRKKVFSR